MKKSDSLQMTNKVASKSDLEILLQIEKQMQNYPLYHTFSRNEFEKYLSSNNNTTFLLYLNEEIEGMAILEQFRHKGLGTYAMNLMLEKLKDYKTIMLVTHPENNNSLRLYLKFGFVIKSGKIIISRTNQD
jgi:hypothetical protein